MHPKFFITTPIYYASGLPHIGNAYSSFIADLFARYKRLLGYKVKFSTGLDENGQKMVQKAEAQGKAVMEFLDEIADGSKDIRDSVEISYTDFIRTTQEDHKLFVQSVLKKVFDKNQTIPETQRDFYKGEYHGLYCTPCEGFKKESDLIPHPESGQAVCPDHLIPPEKISEKNRFFRLSKYQKSLENFYNNNPNFIIPTKRANEIKKKYLEEGLEDFSISRQNNNFGIPLPFDQDQITYIWYDALLNYLTVCQEQDEDFRTSETQIYHILGKDIAKFHAIYRPAMLISAGFQTPNHEVINGFFTVDGQKMSKTLGNVIYPKEIVSKYGRDPVIFYLFYDLSVGSDGDFSRERFHNTYNKMLIGGWGNLINRISKLGKKYGIKKGIYHEEINKKLFTNQNLISDMFTNGFDKQIIEKEYIDHANFKKYLEHWYQIIQNCNEYLQNEEPWKKYKNKGTQNQAIQDLQHLIYICKNLSILSAPFMIKGFEIIKKIFNNKELNELYTEKTMGIDQMKSVFDKKEFDLDLQPQLIYKKID